MAGGENEIPRIDTDLYSRQIGAFGMEAMGKLMQLRVLITGLNGQGVECGERGDVSVFPSIRSSCISSSCSFSLLFLLCVSFCSRVAPRALLFLLLYVSAVSLFLGLLAFHCVSRCLLAAVYLSLRCSTSLLIPTSSVFLPLCCRSLPSSLPDITLATCFPHLLA